MSESADQERQHAASPTQIARAIAAGQVVRSQTLAVAFQSIVQICGLAMLLAGVGSGLILWTQATWSQPLLRWQQLGSSGGQIQSILQFMGGPLLASLIVVWISQWASWLVQLGWQFGKRPLMHWEQWTPGQLISAFGSREKWCSQGIGLTQFAASLAICGYWGVADWQTLVGLYQCPPEAWGETLMASVLRQLVPLVAIIVVGAGADWLCQRHWYYQRLAMSDQQLREEQRADGGSLATRQRQISRRSAHSPTVIATSTSVSAVDQIRS